MRTVVGVDIGGTGVRAARVDADGGIGSAVRRAPADRDPDSVIAAVVDAVRETGPANAVGVGCPGFIRDGVVVASPNFPSWRDVSLAERLSAALSVRVVVENDANAAALGAWWLRGAREDLVMLTLGTGVGGGVVTGGRLLRGSNGLGAELGHVYAGGDMRCPCGGVGCLETWCGTAGLVRRARALGHPIDDGRALVAAAEAGEPWATALLGDAGTALGRALVGFVNVFAPRVVLLAGGMTAARTWLAPPAEGWLHAHGIAPAVRQVEVVWEGPADGFAIAGAAAAARGEHG